MQPVRITWHEPGTSHAVFHSSSEVVVPATEIAAAGEHAARRFLEFFAVERSATKNTRLA